MFTQKFDGGKAYPQPLSIYSLPSKKKKLSGTKMMHGLKTRIINTEIGGNLYSTEDRQASISRHGLQIQQGQQI